MSAVILNVLVSKIDAVQVLDILKKADSGLLIAVMCVLIFVNITMDVCRWKAILERLRYPISFKEALLIKVAANLIISVLPFRSGEFSRLVFLKRFKDVPYSKTTLSIMVEYAQKIFILLLYLVCGAGVYWWENQQSGAGQGSVSLYASVLPLCFFQSVVLSGWVGRWQEKYFPALKLHFTDLKSLFKDRTIFFYNFLYTSTDFINFYLLAKSLSINIPLSAILFFLPLVLFISCLPFTIAGLGVRELTILSFFHAYASPELLFSLGILHSFVEFVLPFFITVLIILIFSKDALQYRVPRGAEIPK